MGNYNFHSSDTPLGETRRLGDLPEEVKKLEAKQAMTTQVLGDEKAFLNVVQSEALDDEYMNEEDFAELKERNRHFLKIVVAVAIVVGLIVCIVGFIIMTSFLDKGSDMPVDAATAQAATAQAKESNMLVRSITDMKELLIFDLDSGQNYTIKTGKETTISGKNGETLQLKDISPGDILRMNVITANQMATKISYPRDAWVKEGINGVEVDTLAKSITAAGEGVSGGVLTYTEDALFLYKEKALRAEDLTTADTMTIRGIGNTLWSAEVTGFHGYVTIVNGSSITNATMQVDGSEPQPMETAKRIPIAEGVHELLFKGDNIEDRTEPVFIIADEDTTVDLSAAQSKTGVLIVKVNTDAYKIFINGTEAKADLPIVLPQGSEYEIAVTKEGFLPWSMTVSLNEPSLTIDATLTEVKQKGSLTITTTPVGATVTLDGSYLGVTPIARQVELGEHVVSAQLNGYATYHGTVSLDGATGLVNIPLTSLEEDIQQRRTKNEGTKRAVNTGSDYESAPITND